MGKYTVLKHSDSTTNHKVCTHRKALTKETAATTHKRSSTPDLTSGFKAVRIYVLTTSGEQEIRKHRAV